MSLTLSSFTAVLVLVVGAGIAIEVLRGLRRNLVWTAVSLATVVLSALVAAPLAVWLSDFPAQRLGDLLLDLLPSLDALSESFPSILPLITGIADALLSPVLFVFLFLILRLIARITVSILFRKPLSPLPDDPADPMYEGANAPWYRRHSRLLGGLTGGLCGLIASMILLSPVVGALSTADNLLDGANSDRIKWESMGFEEELIDSVRSVSGDPAVAVLEAMGCGLIFDASACTRLNGNPAYLRREADACMAAVDDIVVIVGMLQSPEDITPDQREALGHLEERIQASEAVKMIAADTVNLIADTWLEGNTFMKIGMPEFGELVDPLMTGILRVCAESNASCVSRDIGTLLRIYLIAVDNDLLVNPDYDELADSLDEGGVLNLIYDELVKNPCMAHLAGKLTDMSLRIMMSALEWSDISEQQMESLMGDLSDALNQINGQSGSAEERVETMKEYTMQYAEKYGIKVPPALAEMASVALIEKLGDRGSSLTSEDLWEFLEDFSS